VLVAAVRPVKVACQVTLCSLQLRRGGLQLSYWLFHFEPAMEQAGGIVRLILDDARGEVFQMICAGYMVEVLGSCQIE
jgi:hypothetical protein